MILDPASQDGEVGFCCFTRRRYDGFGELINFNLKRGKGNEKNCYYVSTIDFIGNVYS